MNKEEILERSKKENAHGDERDRLVSAQATTYGALGMAFVVVILFFIRISKGGTGYDLLAMYFSYLAASYIYRFKLLRDKENLLSALVYCFMTIVWFVLFILKG